MMLCEQNSREKHSVRKLCIRCGKHHPIESFIDKSGKEWSYCIFCREEIKEKRK
jgi:tRNA(Ile)-lysidine synthase TilS/MesJ